MALQECGLNLNKSQRELQMHGTPEFPCAAYLDRLSAPDGRSIPWHWHNELEMLCAASGELKLQVPAGTLVLREGDCAVVNGSVLHSAEAQPRCELRSLVFSPLLIGGADTAAAKRYVAPLLACRAFRAHKFGGADAAPMAAHFAAAFSALESDAPGYEFTVREHLSAVCYGLFMHYESSLPAGRDSHSQDELRLRRMFDYIQEHLAEDMSLAQIAGAAGVGPRECIRCFQRAIRLPPMQYVLSRRVMCGAELLLARPEDSVAAVAAACGFDSPSYFSKLFRRSLGCTPRAYRRDRAQTNT